MTYYTTDSRRAIYRHTTRAEQRAHIGQGISAVSAAWVRAMTSTRSCRERGGQWTFFRRDADGHYTAA